MPIYGAVPSQSIYPGDIGLLVGVKGLPGTPIVDAHESFASNAKSRPVVVAARPGGQASSQRQIIWRVFGTGTVDIKLQASIDDVDGNYVTIDEYSSSGSSGSRVVPADMSTSPGTPESQATAKIVSSARFFRAVNAGSDVSVTVDIACQ